MDCWHTPAMSAEGSKTHTSGNHSPPTTSPNASSRPKIVGRYWWEEGDESVGPILNSPTWESPSSCKRLSSHRSSGAGESFSCLETDLLEQERALVAKEVLLSLSPPHKINQILPVFLKAVSLDMEGALIEELGIIILQQSQVSLLERYLRVSMECDDVLCVTQAINTARSFFLNDVKSYAASHCFSHAWIKELKECEEDVLARTDYQELSKRIMCHDQARRAAEHVASGNNYQAAVALFEMLDVERAGRVRAHHLMALCSFCHMTADEIEELYRSLPSLQVLPHAHTPHPYLRTPIPHASTPRWFHKLLAPKTGGFGVDEFAAVYSNLIKPHVLDPCLVNACVGFGGCSEKTQSRRVYEMQLCACLRAVKRGASNAKMLAYNLEPPYVLRVTLHGTEGVDALLGEGVEATPEKKKEGAYLLVQLGGETQRAEVCASRQTMTFHQKSLDEAHYLLKMRVFAPDTIGAADVDLRLHTLPRDCESEPVVIETMWQGKAAGRVLLSFSRRPLFQALFPGAAEAAQSQQRPQPQQQQRSSTTFVSLLVA